MFLVFGGQQHSAAPPRLRSVPWLAAACLSAAALLLIAGCASGSSGSAAKAAPPSPRQAILLAAVQAQKLTSATEVVSVQASGAQGGGTFATLQIRLKPKLEVSEDTRLTLAGKTVRFKAIITGTAMYFSEPSMASQTGKPWVKIGLSSIKGTGGASFAQIWQDLQANEFGNQTQLLSATKNAHVVGTQTVDGVPTTEYAGSITVAEGLKGLPPRLRSALAPQLNAMGRNTRINFRLWIDDQHQIRKLAEVETVNGETIHTTMNITAINQPVHIVLPPASQTAMAPGS
jgi:hypothetical protein